MLYQCHYAKSYRILEGARIKRSETDYSPKKYVQTSRPNSATVRVLEIIVEAIFKLTKKQELLSNSRIDLFCYQKSKVVQKKGVVIKKLLVAFFVQNEPALQYIQNC